MNSINAAALALAFAFLPFLPTYGTAIKGFGNTGKTRALDLQSFPPTELVVVDLGIIAKYNTVTDISIPVVIGDVEFKLVLDTGSGVTWVMSDQIKQSRYRTNTKYRLGNFESCDSVKIAYGDGLSVTGLWVEDDVTISGCRRAKYRVVAVTQIENDKQSTFRKNNIDGIFGAGVGPRKSHEPDPWLMGTRFSLDINLSGSSTMAFGNIDMSAAGAIPIDLHSQAGSEWIVPSEKFGQVLLDNGDDYVRFPRDFIAEYLADTKHWPPYSADNKFNTWLVECSATLPPMKIKLGSQDLTIPGSRLLRPKKDGNKDGKCVVYIGAEEGLATLGMPFFLDHKVTFDAAGRRVVIAAK